MSTDLEKRVEKLEEWMDHLPRIINTSFDEAEAQRDVIKARIDRLQTDFEGLRTDFEGLRTDLKADIADVRADMAGMRSDIAQLSAKFDAMPRVIAEMLAARE